MRKELIEKQGYVLRLSPYKETDAMVTAFNEGGLFSFLARGVRKMTSKNAASCQVLSLSRFSLLTSADGRSLTLSESEPISPMPQKEELSWLGALSFLAEVSVRFSEEGGGAEHYPVFAKAMDAIRNGYPILSACLLYFASILNNLGYGLQVDGCVLCGKKEGIIGISYEEGGFVCEDCADELTERPGARDLKILRYAFRYKVEDFGRVAFEDKESVRLLVQLARYAENCTGVRLKSLALLEKSV